MTLGKSVNLSGPLVTPCGSICLKPHCLDEKKKKKANLYFCPGVPSATPGACLTSEQKGRLPAPLMQPFPLPCPASHVI